MEHIFAQWLNHVWIMPLVGAALVGCWGALMFWLGRLSAPRKPRTYVALCDKCPATVLSSVCVARRRRSQDAAQSPATGDQQP